MRWARPRERGYAGDGSRRLVVLRRRSGTARATRWIAAGLAVIVSAGALVVALAVVPQRTGGSLLATWLWAAAPDLVISAGLTLVLAAVAIALLVAVLLRWRRDPASARGTTM